MFHSYLDGTQNGVVNVGFWSVLGEAIWDEFWRGGLLRAWEGWFGVGFGEAVWCEIRADGTDSDVCNVTGKENKEVK